MPRPTDNAPDADLRAVEARLNAVGMPYEWFACPAAPGGAVVLVGGWEVSTAGRWFRVCQVLTGRTDYVPAVDQVFGYVFLGRRIGG